MRAAPPVRVRSRSAGSWLAIQSLLYGAAGAVAAYWAGAQLLGPSPGLFWASLLPGGVAALAGRRLVEPPIDLTWDGTTWSLRAEEGVPRAGRPTLMLDLGDWMLVRFVAPAGERSRWRRVRWLPLARGDAGAAWPTLRIALYHDRAPARPGSPSWAGPSA